jgi:hypothetical protein
VAEPAGAGTTANDAAGTRGGVMAMPYGLAPTAMAVPGALVAMVMGVTVPEP